MNLISIISVLIILFIFVIFIDAEDTLENAEDTLQLVNIYIRHGDRTASFTYNNDPYKNDKYYPYGMGQLNTNGKTRMLKIGHELRNRYKDFLGDIYTPDLIFAISSDYDRTKMTIQLILTAMFPPSQSYIIDSKYTNWQPIPYDFIKLEDDDMLAFWGKCKYFILNISENYFSSPYYKQMDNEYADLYNYISEHSGNNISSVYIAGIYYDIFRSQIEHGLQIPNWALSIYPEPLRLLHKKQWPAYVDKFEDRKMATGRLFKSITDSFKSKINDTLPNNRKVYLYSGHDYGTSGLLAALNIEHNYKLPYGNHIIFELHKINGDYIVKVFYQDFSENEPVLRTIGGCSQFCPINKFVELTKDYFPDPDICYK